MQANHVSASHAQQCIICFGDDTDNEFVDGPFCPNEQTVSYLNSRGLQASSGNHGRIHPHCLRDTLNANNRCPICRLNNIGPMSDDDLFEKDLRGVNLSFQDLSGRDLSGSNLTGQNLSNRNLAGIILDGANLEGVNFNGSNMFEADLQGARTTGASFRGTNLRGSMSDSTTLHGMNLDGALT